MFFQDSNEHRALSTITRKVPNEIPLLTMDQVAEDVKWTPVFSVAAALDPFR
jgi:hypothetical protein